MKAMCKALANHEVNYHGTASTEWYTRDGKPQIYCYGFIDKKTDELIDTCEQCRKNVCFAQEDLENYLKGGTHD